MLISHNTDNYLVQHFWCNFKSDFENTEKRHGFYFRSIRGVAKCCIIGLTFIIYGTILPFAVAHCVAHKIQCKIKAYGHISSMNMFTERVKRSKLNANVMTIHVPHHTRARGGTKASRVSNKR